jgi:hypothetical protein
MKKTIVRTSIICCYFIFLTLAMVGQNPLPALDAYQHDTHNNLIDIDKEIENDFGNISFANVYFRYYKNPLYNQTFSPIKLMLIRMEYEFMLQVHIESKNETTFNFPFLKNEDKLTKVKLVCITEKNGKSSSKKLPNKYYETVVKDSIIIIKLNMETIELNAILRIFCSVESLDINLKNLASMDNISNSKQYISFNVPEIFKYRTESQYLDLVKLKSGDMSLTAFFLDIDSYNAIIENYNVNTSSYTWKVKDQVQSPNISFPLVSINLPLGSFIGTDVNEIINKGK